jgi:ADP-heptose:LPS heptosyltransferase
MADSQRTLLFVRPDRIGDLVLTLPIDQAFEGSGFRVVWMIQDSNSFVMDACAKPREFTTLKPGGLFQQMKAFFEKLKDLNPEAIVFVHGRWWMYVAAALAKIPKRLGVRSQWASLLFLTHGLRQKRSDATKNELHYNWDLAEWVRNQLAMEPSARPLTAPTPLVLSPSRLWETTLSGYHLKPKNYFVVHAGMAGSARNWGQLNYLQLIIHLKEKKTVVMTGTKTDEPHLQLLKERLWGDPKVIWLDQHLPSPHLIDVLYGAAAVIAPSTGVVHLAASLGVPTLGLYSPVKVQSPIRWGAIGPNVENQVPNVSCPGQFSCLMERCQHFDCMNLMSPQSVAQTSLLAKEL